MKLGPVTKLDNKQNNVKKFDDDFVSFMSANCNDIVIFLIYSQFEAIWKPDSGRMVCKTYIFIKTDLFIILQKLKTELKNL